MRAIVFERNGGPEVLELRDVPAPTPGEGEVLVDVEAIGVNYRDVYEREGGGYGSPLDRAPEHVAHDVAEVWISPERARKVYGVEVTPEGAVDRETTERLRGRLAAA